MAKKKNRKKRSFTVPLAIVAPVVAIPFVPSREGWASPLQDAQEGKWKAIGAHIINGFVPFYEVHDPDNFAGKFGLHIPRYLAMILGGTLVHMIASKLGVNRAIASSGIPFVRV